MLIPQPKHGRSLLTADGTLLFATRSLRMFAYGFLSVALMLYLAAIGLDERQIGVLISMALLGDTVLSLWMTTAADRIGRKRMLMMGGLLMAAAGAVFVFTNNFRALIVAATIGVLSPNDKEVGPFLSIEQAALAQEIADQRRTAVFAWYNLAGNVAAALGALAGGFASQQFLEWGAVGADVYRPLVAAYAIVGVVLVFCFAMMSPAVEAPRPSPTTIPRWLGLHRSRRVVLQLSALFALDAFGGGFILQSILAYWFHWRFGLEPAALGSIFFVANLVSAASALAASSLARRIGLVPTMVFTHLPAQLLIILVPLMPNAAWAIGVLLLRFCISQMDVPARQSYTMTVVDPDERSAASGITTVARSIGAALAPMLAGLFLASPRYSSLPFFLAGGIKATYDLWLYFAFASRDPSRRR